ncbi:restriction endonuclease subunit S [Finegoldia magna]|uniref:Type I restriction modification DNA specificity domain protein n=1 Tax=Finegoldia magna ATCC 53516 TaxID=525282 RepID=D6S6K0_FINMA|nr:restriction endonuclease subunit S [Finegoldia magna]EFH93704.1 type I restriction modification DNA specificity domain protein [Finegoldia magna ATCC 53516]MBS5942377.1 restriction endonuclease subunit S [Finegoldia magna]MDU1579985.1 restriction endonuclease subunit S [Finegoldia magna]MDU1600895.1 restriction endonuclease subunit S [Finegoldia magna]
MTPQELKNSILQRAIEGKLVDQRPEEGTGAELFEKIQKEKKKLVEEGKIKKQKSQEEINEDEIPFDIPETWKWVRVGTIFQHNTGKALNRANREGIELEYITTSNLYWDRFELDNLKKMYFKEIELKKYGVMKGDLLVCEGGDVGRAAIWEYESSVMIQNHIHRLRAYYSICTRFFYYLFYLYKNAGLIGGKGIGIKGLSTRALGSIVFPLPPLAEQKRIVEKIEELMPLVDKYEKNWQKLEELNKKFPEDMKKSLLQEAIKGKLVEQRKEEGTGAELFEKIQKEKKKLVEEGRIKKQKALPQITEEEIPFDIPENWKWTRLNECIDVRDGTHDTPKYIAKGYPLVTSKNLKHGKIDFSNCKFISKEDHIKISKRSKVDVNDILFAMIGSIGNPVKVRDDNEFSIKNMALFKPIKNNFNMDYLFWFLYISQDNMKKIAYGAVQSFVSLKFLREYLIPLPPLAEQKRIVEKLDEMLAYCDELLKII